MLKNYAKKNLDEIVRLYVAAFKVAPISYDWLTVEQSRRYLRDITRFPGFLGFVYLTEGAVSAFCFGVLDNYFQGTLFEIKEFAVSPACHNRGIGSLLISDMQKKLTEHGVEGITLQTSRHIPAYNFYLKNNFEEITTSVSLIKWINLTPKP